VKTALKDLDFKRFIIDIPILKQPYTGKASRSPSPKRKKGKKPDLKSIIEADAKFFEQNDIIDYSLLIGYATDPACLKKELDKEERKNIGSIYFDTNGKAYVMGIIDIFTEYSSRKKLEYYYKRLKDGQTMSCVPPDIYAQRFTRFLSEAFSLDKGV
jgi:1-phosphatidylinositol-4-phosphate 5-kinase